jgi:serine/threonine-protein kinase RsbW
MASQFALTITNNPDDRLKALDQFEVFFRAHQLPGKALMDLQLALEELLTNISSYGYTGPEEHPIRIRANLLGAELHIEVEDEGIPFNPLAHPPPDLTLPLAERPIGGLGIHMIRKSVDQLDYRREGQKNILVLVKKV